MPGHLTSVTGSGSSVPTPGASDAGRAGSLEAWKQWEEGGITTQFRLRNAVHSPAMFATPTATANQLAPSMQKHPGCREWWPTPRAQIRPGHIKYSRGRFNLEEEGGASVPGGGKLNPPWVEWLMGWPIGWTDCEPLETGRCQQWLRSHGLSCCDD